MNTILSRWVNAISVEYHCWLMKKLSVYSLNTVVCYEIIIFACPLFLCIVTDALENRNSTHKLGLFFILLFNYNYNAHHVQ